jgi:hypothetical protein
MNADLLKAELSLDVRPAVASDDGLDAGHGNPELVRQESAGPTLTELMGAPNLKHGIIGQLGALPSSLTLGWRLETKSNCMDHLLTHRGKSKILNSVVGLDAIQVIDRQSARYRPPEGRINEAVDQKLSGIAACPSGEAHSEIPIPLWVGREFSGFLTPETRHSADASNIADFVDPLVTNHGAPHEC